MLRLTKVQHHHSLTNAFQLVFLGKPIGRLFYEVRKLGNHTISYQSLLLSTTVINDIYVVGMGGVDILAYDYCKAKISRLSRLLFQLYLC